MVEIFNKLLVANRGEIAIRVFRAANELNIKTVAIYSEEDKLALHRFKADESYRIGEGLGPVRAYLDIEGIIDIAKKTGADAIHPGYGFLSESPEFVKAVTAAGLVFIGPDADAMSRLGNKVAGREWAERANTPVPPATGALDPEDAPAMFKAAEAIGYPLMLKASWGGGGRGMRVIRSQDELVREVGAGCREAEAAFGNGEVFLEKLVERACHVEVQILADSHGQVVHLWERDCSVQRRNQKVVERAPAPYFDNSQREKLCMSAVRLAKKANYLNAGTAEFLMDRDSGECYFIEFNPRIQVEHTVTEEVTGIDIVKAQIRIAAGGRIGDLESSGVPEQADIKLSGHALQCRITTEDPEDNFVPDYGRITAYRGATGFGVRLDGGTAYSGAVITRHYDSMLEKVTCWAPSVDEAIQRMIRALREFRIRGVSTNLAFVQNLINHPVFREAAYTTRFIDQTPELFLFDAHRDRASKLLQFVGEVTLNGNSEVKGRPEPLVLAEAALPKVDRHDINPPEGSKHLLDKLGPEGLSAWLLAETQPKITDTTMRDGHQSLLATRMRTRDLVRIAPAYASTLTNLFSLECWGGATFDVAMRFLKECPWQRLRAIRAAAPNIMLQMLLRGANAVGYTTYPDNVIQAFIRQSKASGVDLFRVFDSLNWVENMRVAMDEVLEAGGLLEGTICYTGDILDPDRTRYDLDYYLRMAKSLKAAGSHIIGLKDMAGILKPAAARVLIPAIKSETGLPVHFHTHDTSGIASSTILAAVEAGVDVFDAAMDPFSGLTSQPCLGALVEALKGTDYDTGLSRDQLAPVITYWDAVRRQYAAFESDLRAGASEVYLHEMPGGQFTNLKEQAASLGLSKRWREVAETYAEVNDMFGDLVKVTPTSKVVGDMALAMVAGDITRHDIEHTDKDIAFPDSVVALFRGDLGRPEGGFPPKLQARILKGALPLEDRAGATLEASDFDALRHELMTKLGLTAISDEHLLSWLMYPKVFETFWAHLERYGDVSNLPTHIFFYGMNKGDEVYVDLDPGKTLVMAYLGHGVSRQEGYNKLFFELNGQPRTVRVVDTEIQSLKPPRLKGDPDNQCHLIAPMPGLIGSLLVQAGDEVREGALLFTIEAMKMETAIHADRDGVIDKLMIKAGDQVEAKDLLLEYQRH